MKNKQLNRLKVVLAEKNVSNKELAEQIGVGQATMSKWVTNTSQPNLEMLVKISSALGVTIDELVRTPSGLDKSDYQPSISIGHCEI